MALVHKNLYDNGKQECLNYLTHGGPGYQPKIFPSDVYISGIVDAAKSFRRSIDFGWNRLNASYFVSVFGVSANSMQCSYGQRGNSVPTILLTMKKRLYSGGGLQAEKNFWINAENTEEESVRNHLNRGVVARGIDVHCLEGLIKASVLDLIRLNCHQPVNTALV
ncbi:hypothetical protein AgCh_013144 [Apium graveolens]